jgi:hypothetical protein
MMLKNKQVLKGLSRHHVKLDLIEMSQQAICSNVVLSTIQGYKEKHNVLLKGMESSLHRGLALSLHDQNRNARSLSDIL